MIVGASCTAELIQDDPGGLAKALGLPMPVVPLELPAYQRKENWGAAETFYQLVRALAGPRAPPPGTGAARATRRAPRCNILGPTALGFRHRDDVARDHRPARAGWASTVNVVAPLGATPADLARLGEADFNVVLYPEIAGAGRALAGAHLRPAVDAGRCRSASARRATSSPRWPAWPGSIPRRAGRASRRALPWYSRSVDSTYLTGKRVFIFGDATHAIAAARVAARGARLQGRRPRHLQPRVRPRGARGGRAATASSR